MGSAEEIERARLRQDCLVLVAAATRAHALTVDVGTPTQATRPRNCRAWRGFAAVEGSFASGNVHIMIAVRGEEEDNLFAYLHGELRVCKGHTRPVKSVAAIVRLASEDFPRRTDQSGGAGVECGGVEHDTSHEERGCHEDREEAGAHVHSWSPASSPRKPQKCSHGGALADDGSRGSLPATT